MHKIESYSQVQDFVRQIRETRRGFVTNFYWDENKHPYWIAEGTFEYEQSDNCILMVHHCEGFLYLFYIATSLTAIDELFNTLQLVGPIVVDIVCKGEGTAELNTFANLGFVKYQHLYRMSHVGKIIRSDWHQDVRARYGEKGDAITVFDVMQKDFDPLAEQLPTIKELEDFAERKQLLVIKDGDNLCGFLVFELTGVTWYLRYWYTSPDYRDKGIGAGLLKTSLLFGADSKRQIFWVIADNENAIKRYEHYGFTREDMNDYVMIKQ